MVAPPCGLGRWRSALINPTPGVHRTFYLNQFIKEKLILGLSLRLMQLSSFLSPAYTNPHVVLYPYAVLEPRIELLGCISAQDHSFTGRKGPIFWGPASGKRTYPQRGLELCSHLAWFRTLSLHALPS
jgi:hypothetical protein